MAESSQNDDPRLQQDLSTLHTMLRNESYENKLDGYGLYVYGAVLKQLNRIEDAVILLIEAVHKEPMHWGGWMELVTLTDVPKLKTLPLPDHWMTQIFIAHVLLEQQLEEKALEIYLELDNSCFPKNPYILSQIAACYNSKKDTGMAIETFTKLHKQDPYRMDDLDTFSHCLFVTQMRTKLAYLAHHAVKVDKYRVETCLVLGNYYALQGDHNKSALHFQRALKLNPQCLSALILIGQQFLEMKNVKAAIQTYRQALEINPQDFRAWNGLGVTFEIVQAYSLSLHCFKQAQLSVKRDDATMLFALGDVYEKLGKFTEAIKCFVRVRALGDRNGDFMLRIGKLYDKLNDTEQAVKVFNDYVAEHELSANEEPCMYAGLSYACKYLTNYYLKHDQLDTAYIYAQKCLNNIHTHEEAKALIKAIADQKGGQALLKVIEDQKGGAALLEAIENPKRGQEDEEEMQVVDETGVNFERYLSSQAS